MASSSKCDRVTRTLDDVLFPETGQGGAIWDGTTAGFGLGDAFLPISIEPHLAMVHRNLSRRTTAVVEDLGP